MRKLLGIFTSITAALLVVSVAWAAGDDDRRVETGAALDVSAGASASADQTSTSSTGATLPTSSSTSVTTASSSTSVTTADSSTSTTSAGSSTSTTGAGNTSSTVETKTTVDVGGTFQVPGVGSVTVDITAGVLHLTAISAPGWEVEIKDLRHDRVRVDFDKGEAEARFEARLEDGRLRVKIEHS